MSETLNVSLGLQKTRVGGRLAHIYNRWVTVAKKTLHHSEHAHRWSMRMLQDGAVYEALVRQADSFLAWTNPPKKGVAQWGRCNLFSYVPGLAARALVEIAWSRGWVKLPPLQPQFGASVYYKYRCWDVCIHVYICIYINIYIYILHSNHISKSMLYIYCILCVLPPLRYLTIDKFMKVWQPGHARQL